MISKSVEWEDEAGGSGGKTVPLNINVDAVSTSDFIKHSSLPQASH